jgi:serine/threonine protein kinase
MTSIEQATQVDHTGALDATLDSPHSRGPKTDATQSGPRTTVLPRVEWTGAEPSIVAASRPRFQRTRALGAGGLGEVVAAMDHDIGREVAIKRLRVDVTGPAAVARFVDEIRTVGQLEHPNILPIHDVGSDEDGSLYFVMPCVQGETLESVIERLANGDPLMHAHYTFERRVQVFRRLLDAVAFAHGHGYVHRDIKPANVMIGPYGEVFLMDWGIAKPLRGHDPAAVVDGLPSSRVTTTQIGSIVGTPAYMSPEQASGEPVDARTDVYALSALFFEFLSLRHYLEDCKTIDEVLQGARHRVPPHTGFVKHAHQSSAPMDLGWFVKKGMEKDPARRYQTVREMIERLDARDEGLVPIQCHVTASKRVLREAIRFIDRHPFLFTMTLALGLIGGVGLAVWRLLRH